MLIVFAMHRLQPLLESIDTQKRISYVGYVDDINAAYLVCC